MIYDQPAATEPLSQGDIVDDCPILFWEYPPGQPDAPPESTSARVRVVVLTQACDLEQSKSSRVLAAVVHHVQHLVDRGILKSAMIRDQVRTHRVYGWYFLPAGAIEEAIVDLHDLHTLPRTMLDRLIRDGKRQARIQTPYREHLAQHFATTYARIGLPRPYPSEPES